MFHGDPNFRDQYRGLFPLFANAVLLGRSFQARGRLEETDVRRCVLSGLMFTSFAAGAQVAPVVDVVPRVELRPGMVITRSVRVVRRTYKLAGRGALDSALITIRGENITVDFDSATMQGIASDADPDLATGVAIRVDGGRNIRIVNARVRGYRFGIMARGTRNLQILDSDLSYSWKPRLFSLVEHESLVDWLSFHKNDKDEWLRFGAAIYLDSVRVGEIRGVRAQYGMNALQMSRTEYVRAWNNIFTFNSGLGIGMYRSSHNTIVHNQVNFNVRGYSHGRYRRGQDSAGILVFEQSSNNIFAYNSVTHGGDGFFLWAGQSTMDTGAGGANDNMVYGNDFSFAPTNGIEATFSRNVFIANRVVGNDHGVWGGYSFESRFVGNTFARNRIGVAIEHGQANVVAANSFDGDSTAISLWANRIEPSEWGYPRHRDTRSRDARIDRNVFRRNRVGMRVLATEPLFVSQNRFVAVDSLAVLDDSTRTGAIIDTLVLAPDTAARPVMPAGDANMAPAKLPGGFEPSASRLARMDRAAIVIDEWGPYDWRAPKLWPIDSTRANPIRLRVLGPTGTWRIISRRGIESTSADSGRIGDTLTVGVVPSSFGDWEITLAPVGTGKPFTYGRFEPLMQWKARIYGTASDSAREPDMRMVTSRAPIIDTTLARLDYMWFRPTVAVISKEMWALDATATVTLPAGVYTLRTISDDGIRVWLDGVLVIDNWTSHESAVNNAPMTAGTHEVHVQYYQRDSWTELRVEVVRGTLRSVGSPGPH